MIFSKQERISLRIHAFSGFGPIFLMAAFFVGLADTAVAGITLAASPSPATFGAPVTLTATLNPTSATGKVTFYDGAVILGTSTISGGVATLRVPLNSSGQRSLSARYLGDSKNPAAIAPAVLESVNSVPAFGFIPTNLNLGVNIQDFAVADFNGDGKADVVVATFGNIIAVALGNGDGTFAPPITTLGGVVGQFASVVAADFDGDGKVDIALGDHNSNNIWIYLGHGDGTFGAPTSYTTADGPAGPMVVADFNLDGIPDLVIVHAQSFAILLGDGDGSFGSPVEYSAGGIPGTVSVGDVNGDGKPDLVTVVPTADEDGLLIVVLLGKGDGTFSAPNSYILYKPTPGEFISAIVLEDVNGDGKLDLAIAAALTRGVWLCLGHGDGTFAAPVQYYAAGQDQGSGVGIAAVDINGDRKMDLIADLELSTFLGAGLGNELQTFYGNGDGTFQQAEILNPPATHLLTKLVPVDLNGDGRVDLLSWGYDSTNNAVLKLFSGGAFPEVRTSATHIGNFTLGQMGATFTILVSNDGATATTGFIKVNYQLNGFMNLDSMSGVGWTCSNTSATCSRTDSLAPGSSYPPITVTADVQTGAPAPVLTANSAIVSGGGSQTSEANDPLNIEAGIPPTITTLVSPASGSALQQTFTVNVSDTAGAADVSAIFLYFNASFSPSANSCLIEYYRPTNTLYLLNNAGTAWPSISVGSAGTLSNSQCSVNAANASANFSGASVVLALPVVFRSNYSGVMNVYAYAAGASANSGWETVGTWTVPAAVNAVSVSPAAGSGLQQTFAVQYSDSVSANDLSTMFVYFNATFSPSSNSCLVEYSRPSNILYLLNDAGNAWSSVSVGSSVGLSNSQCSVNAASTSVNLSANGLTLNLPVTFAATYIGAKNIYAYAAGSSANSGWQTLGSWTVPGSAVVNAVSVSPASDSGMQQTFVVQYSDSVGATDLSTMFIYFNATFSPSSNSCLVEYYRPSSTLYLLNDGGNAWSAATVGSSTTVSNSQCSISAASASVNLSATGVTLNLPVTFAATYIGAKNIYAYAAGSSANSGWQTLGTWTVPGSAVVSAVSMSPASGNGLQQTFVVQYSDSVGATDLSTMFVYFTATFSASSNSCLVEYYRPSNILYLLNDAGTTWAAATIGSSTTLSNSQCSINAALASMNLSASGLALNLPVTFAPTFAGIKNSYAYAAGSSANSGWQTLGSWTIP